MHTENKQNILYTFIELIMDFGMIESCLHNLYLAYDTQFWKQQANFIHDCFALGYRNWTVTCF